MTVDIVRLIKKHSALLLPIGIALAAVLLFVPTLLAGKSVRSQMQESVDIGGQIRFACRKYGAGNAVSCRAGVPAGTCTGCKCRI